MTGCVVNATAVCAATGTRIAPASTSGGVNGTGGTARVPGTDRNIFQFRRELILDLRVSKRFKIGDRVEAELLGESFNLANHLNQTGVGSMNAYGVSNGTATTPNVLTNNAANFGVFNPSTFLGNANNNFIYTPRQVQLGARLQF